jgi:Protein of unknown function (DUF3800)
MWITKNLEFFLDGRIGGADPDMNLYCDESGGVGRGVMTLAAVSIEPDAATDLLVQFKKATGLRSELKGSRIDLEERAYFFNLFEKSGAKAIVGVALSALKPREGEDRGDHDQHVYAALINDVLAAWLPESGGCVEIVLDDGRYDGLIMSEMQANVAALLGSFGTARMEVSHHVAGIQIADVIANSFFNRALVSNRQVRFDALVKPFLESERIRMRVMDRVAE